MHSHPTDRWLSSDNIAEICLTMERQYKLSCLDQEDIVSRSQNGSIEGEWANYSMVFTDGHKNSTTFGFKPEGRGYKVKILGSDERTYQAAEGLANLLGELTGLRGRKEKPVEIHSVYDIAHRHRVLVNSYAQLQTI